MSFLPSFLPPSLPSSYSIRRHYYRYRVGMNIKPPGTCRLPCLNITTMAAVGTQNVETTIMRLDVRLRFQLNTPLSGVEFSLRKLKPEMWRPRELFRFYDDDRANQINLRRYVFQTQATNNHEGSKLSKQ